MSLVCEEFSSVSQLTETNVEEPAEECSTASRIDFNAADIVFILEILFFLAVAAFPDVAAWILDRLAINPKPSTLRLTW